MIKYSISFDLGQAWDVNKVIDETVMPAMAQAVRSIAKYAARDWGEAVMRAKLSPWEKDQYAKSIKIEQTGPFSAFISSDYKFAAEIETGRPPRDLKKMLDTSNKVRRTKSGKRFLVIPMRHGTPGQTALATAMSDSLYDMASGMQPSRIVSEGQRPSGEVTHLSPRSGMTRGAPSPFLSNVSTRQHQMVASRNYAWGDRITRAQLKEAGFSTAEQKRYAGMVRMETSTHTGAKSSAFMTFRVMMEGGKGWVIPAKPGLFLARGVAQAINPKANAVFSAAIARSIKKT